MSDEPKFKIGDRAFLYDVNRRRYDKDRQIIYREHFEPLYVIGQTRMSWIVGASPDASPTAGWARKVKKKQFRPEFGLLTAEGLEDEIWRGDHKHKVMRLVDNATAEQLRRIAEIVGYSEEPTP